MDIYVKLSSDLGSNLGPDFSISTNAGSIIPSSVTKTELLAGKLFNISDNSASSITITSIGTCLNSASFSIDKDSATCYATSPYNYQPGQTRPTDESGEIAPFNTEALDAIEANELLYADEGGFFQITLFGKIITFFIETVFVNEDGKTVKIGTASGPGLNNGEFDILFLSPQSVNAQIYFYEAGIAYTIEGDSSSGMIAKEWAISDLISASY